MFFLLVYTNRIYLVKAIFLNAAEKTTQHFIPCYNPSLDDKMSVDPYVARAGAHFLHNYMDYAITATFDFICRISPREKMHGSIFSPTA